MALGKDKIKKIKKEKQERIHGVGTLRRHPSILILGSPNPSFCFLSLQHRAVPKNALSLASETSSLCVTEALCDLGCCGDVENEFLYACVCTH